MDTTVYEGSGHMRWTGIVSVGCANSLIMFWNTLLKAGDVQSGPSGEIKLSIETGKGVATLDNLGLVRKHWAKLFLDNPSAIMLALPGKWAVDITMSKYSTKNHKQCRKCITVLSLEYLLLITVTKLRLLHWNRTSFLWVVSPRLCSSERLVWVLLPWYPAEPNFWTISIVATEYLTWPHIPMSPRHQFGLPGYVILLN